MNVENKQENTVADKKPTIRQRVSSWLGFLAVAAVILFFFAPESWWQFGVSPTGERKNVANFTLKDINGGAWNFAEQRGKVVVVNYWATWCAPCRVETPGLVNAANQFKGRGVEFVGVTMDENLDDVPSFVAKYEIPYPVLLPDTDANLNANVSALPTTLLFDKDGKLAKKYVGMIFESTLRADVETLLSENQ